jgi:hypothetical protein
MLWNCTFISVVFSLSDWTLKALFKSRICVLAADTVDCASYLGYVTHIAASCYSFTFTKRLDKMFLKGFIRDLIPVLICADGWGQEPEHSDKLLIVTIWPQENDLQERYEADASKLF